VTSPFDARPIIVAIVGPNGAGKSTFHEAHLGSAGLRFLNADELARQLGVDAYQAAEVAGQLRRALVVQGESFVFETVFSDPVGDKLEFLKLAEKKGYTVVLCFIGLDGPDLSEERVAMRVLQGGHDVPSDKLRARYPRTMTNLAKAIEELGHVLVFDNSDMRRPFRKVAVFERGTLVEKHAPLPRWLPRER
jgi:predicted ABC-type ATPase